jgi:branched-chain amino acid transport system substrate-binding protein
MSFDIMDGFKQALKMQGIENSHQIVSSGIGIAGKNEEIYTQSEQMLLDGTDLIIAYINPMAAEFIHPLFVSAGKQLLVLDSGYHFPQFLERLSNARFISLQGALCARAIVRKAVEQGNSNFAFACSFYDAGYRLPYVYSAAAEEKNAGVAFSHVTPLRREDFTLEPLAEYLQDNNKTALFATFCGDMAEDFFRESTKLNLIVSHNTYGSGFIAEEQWLGKIPYPGRDWQCAVPWSVAMDSNDNREFVAAMEGIRQGKANIFSLLGWEAALYIAATNGELSGNISINSPRGKIYMNPETGFSEAPVYYATVTKNKETGNCYLTNITEARGLDIDRERLQHDIDFIRTTTANSWLNAYACLDS